MPNWWRMALLEGAKATIFFFDAGPTTTVRTAWRRRIIILTSKISSRRKEQIRLVAIIADDNIAERCDWKREE